MPSRFRYSEHEVILEILELGREVREIRRSKGMSQKEFAKRHGTSRTAIAIVEQGRRTLNAEQLEKLDMTTNPTRIQGSDFERKMAKKLIRDANKKDAQSKPGYMLTSVEPSGGGVHPSGIPIKTARAIDQSVTSLFSIEKIMEVEAGQFAQRVAKSFAFMEGEHYFRYEVVPEYHGLHGHYLGFEYFMTEAGLKMVLLTSVKTKEAKDLLEWLYPIAEPLQPVEVAPPQPIVAVVNGQPEAPATEVVNPPVQAVSEWQVGFKKGSDLVLGSKDGEKLLNRLSTFDPSRDPHLYMVGNSALNLTDISYVTPRVPYPL
jgi:DNA-binding transcriptional regulator YiaG